MKRSALVLVIFTVLAFSLLFIRDVVFKTVLMGRLSEMVGTRVEIRQMTLGLFSRKARIWDLKIDHPEDFPRGSLLDVAVSGFRASSMNFLKDNPHMERVFVEIREIVFLRNKDGRWNADALRISSASKKKPNPVPIRIDHLDLDIGKVVLKDYRKSSNPIVHVYELNLRDLHYKDLKSVEELLVLIFVQALKTVSIQDAKILSSPLAKGLAVHSLGVSHLESGQEAAEEILRTDFDSAFRTGLRTLSRLGELVRADRRKAELGAEINGCHVVLKIDRETFRKVRIRVSAKRLLLPEIPTAAGILYEIKENLR